MAVAARATAVFGLVFGLAATASALAPALDQPVQGGAPAERGSQESLVTANYPTGPCDLIGGTLAMARDQHPTSVEQIGESVLGRPIQAEHWGPADGPQMLVVASIHGDECSPVAFTRAVREFGPQSPVGIWLIPVLNPDASVIARAATCPIGGP